MPITRETLFPRLLGLVDSKTLAHSYRVAVLSYRMGRALELNEDITRAIRIGGLLHDVGKATIPWQVLEKPGKLLPHERKLVETHPAAGERLLHRLAAGSGQVVLELVRHHHERLDGSGYPDRLQGEQVSLAARVVAVADVYDALTTDRPYCSAVSRTTALRVLDREAEVGRLDRRVVEVLKQVISPVHGRNPALEARRAVWVTWTLRADAACSPHSAGAAVQARRD